MRVLLYSFCIRNLLVYEVLENNGTLSGIVDKSKDVLQVQFASNRLYQKQNIEVTLKEARITRILKNYKELTFRMPTEISTN